MLERERGEPEGKNWNQLPQQKGAGSRNGQDEVRGRKGVCTGTI